MAFLEAHFCKQLSSQVVTFTNYIRSRVAMFGWSVVTLAATFFEITFRRCTKHTAPDQHGLT